MTASADRLVAAGPRPKELWLTVGLSILLHGLLMAVVILVPRFRIGAYVTVPVSYTVDLVSATPGRQAAGPSPAVAAPAPASPKPAPPPAVRSAPPPRPAAPSNEELTLPGKRVAKKAPTEVEPSLRPPNVPERPSLRPAPAEVRPRPSAAPAAVPAPSPPVASVTPTAAPPAATGTGAGTGGGVELAGGERGDGRGGSALGYYLGLVDYKISTNWVPVGTGGRDTVVVVRFRVLRSGQVRDVELETSSGDAGLDIAAMRAINQSKPLPPFPNLLTDPFLDLRYRFVMERG